MASAAPRRLGLLGRMGLRKSVAQIQHETATSELKRSLGPWNLVFLGIGCIIGAGIFVRTGNAAALHAGPAVLISYVIAGIICAFAGLCYAELASTLPVSGSAYTYSYATIGEFAAWVMGALLLLEYGLAASVVAVGWSGYMVSLLGDIGLHIPAALTGPMGHHLQKDGVDVLVSGAPVVYLFNLPAFLVCAALAILLVIGVSESAKFNNAIVAIKVTVLVAFIIVGGFIILKNLPTYMPNWEPFIPPPTGAKGEFGWSGILRAASIVFFAYIGFEAVSTAGQEAKNPGKDMPFGIIGSLVACTIIYILVSIVLTMIVNYKIAQRARSGRGRRRCLRPAMGVVRQDHQGRCDHRPDLGHPGADVRPDPHLLHDGARRAAAEGLRAGPPEVPHAVDQHHASSGLLVACAAGFFDINTLGDMTSVGTLAAFGDRLPDGDLAPADSSGYPARLPGSALSGDSGARALSPASR